MGVFSDQAQESAEKSSTTLKQRWIVRIVFISLTSFCFIVGAILIGVGGSANVRNPIPGAADMLTAGIILEILFAISGITWLSMLCCCDYKWVCTRH